MRIIQSKYIEDIFTDNLFSKNSNFWNLLFEIENFVIKYTD